MIHRLKTGTNLVKLTSVLIFTLRLLLITALHLLFENPALKSAIESSNCSSLHILPAQKVRTIMYTRRLKKVQFSSSVSWIILQGKIELNMYFLVNFAFSFLASVRGQAETRLCFLT